MNYLSLNSFETRARAKIFSLFSTHKATQLLSWSKFLSCILYEKDESYVDNLVEQAIKKLSTFVQKEDFDVQCKDEHIVFFDTFSRDRRGLSQQYIDAIGHSNAKCLYITENAKIYKTKLLAQLKSFENFEIILVPGNIKGLKKSNWIYKKVMTYKPSKILLHIAPWSIECLVSMAAIPKSVIKYNINITDHTYWSGSSVVDQNIEFRDYGLNISQRYRGFNYKNLCLIPYYPIIEDHPFMGFPCNIENKVVIFWGGTLNKVYGRGCFFLKLISHILHNNPQCICICAGGGDDAKLKEYILKEKLNLQWYHIGFRQDIFQVVNRCDIFINTYPFSGGLMSQYAAYCSKPIISYGDEDDDLNYIERILNVDFQLTYTTPSSFYEAANRLIKDSSIRKSLGQRLKDAEFDREGFNKLFQNNVISKKITVTEKVLPDLSNSQISKNKKDYEIEISMIKTFGLNAYFMYPKLIGWTLRFIKLRFF